MFGSISKVTTLFLRQEQQSQTENPILHNLHQHTRNHRTIFVDICHQQHKAEMNERLILDPLRVFSF